MSSELIVSVSGIRGIVGEGLTAEAAARFAAAYGAFVNGGRVILSRDGRPSGEMLRHAVVAGLLSAGCVVDDIGIAPTPTSGFAARFRLPRATTPRRGTASRCSAQTEPFCPPTPAAR
jgi:phosphomannomutase